jgi:hypothetical protein
MLMQPVIARGPGTRMSPNLASDIRTAPEHACGPSVHGADASVCARPHARWHLLRVQHVMATAGAGRVKSIITHLINDHDDSAQAAVLKRFIVTISRFHRPCWCADKCAA